MWRRKRKKDQRFFGGVSFLQLSSPHHRFGPCPAVDGEGQDGAAVDLARPIHMLQQRLLLRVGGVPGDEVHDTLHCVGLRFAGGRAGRQKGKTWVSATNTLPVAVVVSPSLSSPPVRVLTSSLLGCPGLLHACCCLYQCVNIASTQSSSGTHASSSGRHGLVHGTPPSMTSRYVEIFQALTLATPPLYCTCDRSEERRRRCWWAMLNMPRRFLGAESKRAFSHLLGVEKLYDQGHKGVEVLRLHGLLHNEVPHLGELLAQDAFANLLVQALFAERL